MHLHPRRLLRPRTLLLSVAAVAALVATAAAPHLRTAADGPSFCAGVASADVVPLSDARSCPLADLGLAERYCADDTSPEVCAFLGALPADASVACVQDGARVCAAAVAREGDRDFYAVAETPALRALAADPRWQEAPVSLRDQGDGWMTFDPRACPDCGGQLGWLDQLLLAFGIVVY